MSFAGSTVFSGDQAWANNSHKTAAAADLDGDGIEELVVFYVLPSEPTKLNLKVSNKGSVSSGITVSGITLSGNSGSIYFTPSRLNMGTPWFPYLSSTKGDTDGDGYDEILLVDDKTVYLLDVDGQGALCTIAGQKTYATSVSSVAAGDCDGDGKAEFVVCCRRPDTVGDASFSVYDSNFNACITSPEYNYISGAYFNEACFGDFDGDNIDELCVASASGDITARLYNLDTGDSLAQKNTITHNINWLGGQNTGTTDAFRICPRAVDINGDGLDELHLEGNVYNTPMTSSTLYWIMFEGWNTAHTGDDSIIDVAVGDVDCNTDSAGVSDGCEDLVFVSSNAGPGTVATVQVIGLDSSKKVVAKKSDLAIGVGANPWTSVAIAVGNVDNDSSRVKYVKHELTYTDPVVLAVLVSPPFYRTVADKDGAYAGGYPNWTTYFGRSASTGNSDSTSVGFSIGASLDFEQDLSVFGVKIGSVKASVAFTNNTNWEWNTSYTVSQSVQYNCVGGEDKVVFTSVPMDTYSYEVLYSTDPSDKVGGILKINIPRKFDTYMTTREFYNENNGALADIDSTVVAHTIGDPSTYPTKAQKDALLGTYGGYQTDSAKSVAQGSNNATTGIIGLDITVESGKEETVSCDFDVTASAGAGVGGWTAMVSAGFNTGFSYTTSTTAGSQFGGTVGYLPTAYYNDSKYKYSSGLFIYPYNDTRSLRKYWVVDYWIEK